MTKHAPLPWKFTANSWQYTTIYDADDLPVCELDLENWPVTEENQDSFEKEQAKLAAFIVKAVNNHAAMQDALRNACDRLQSFLDTFGDVGGCETQADLNDWCELSDDNATVTSHNRSEDQA